VPAMQNLVNKGGFYWTQFMHTLIAADSVSG